MACGRGCAVGHATRGSAAVVRGALGSRPLDTSQGLGPEERSSMPLSQHAVAPLAFLLWALLPGGSGSGYRGGAVREQCVVHVTAHVCMRYVVLLGPVCIECDHFAPSVPLHRVLQGFDHHFSMSGLGVVLPPASVVVAFLACRAAGVVTYPQRRHEQQMLLIHAWLLWYRTHGIEQLQLAVTAIVL